MKRLLLLPFLLLLGCSETDNSQQEIDEKPIAIEIKGTIPKSRALPTVTHVAAIPVSDNYSAETIFSTMKPIKVLEDGTFHIEGIEENIVVVLLNITDSDVTVVDLVALQQNDEGLNLLPIKDLEPQVIDLGDLDLSNTSAISSLLPEAILDSLSSSEISELASLDDIYRNIENHINNSSKSVDGSEEPQQVFYIKPEIAIHNPLSSLYDGITSVDVLQNAEVDYTLVQFSALPIQIPVTEIGGKFTIQSPSGVSYTCPPLSKQGEVVKEGEELYTRRYSAGTSIGSFLIEYAWATQADAQNELPNHIGNVNFFRVQSDGVSAIPEHGIWKYLWNGNVFGEFDIEFGIPFDTQNQFEGYFPVPKIVSEGDKLTGVSIEWFKQKDGVIEAVQNLTIAEELISNIQVEISTQTYANDVFNETAIHASDVAFNGTTLQEPVYLVNKSLINSDNDVLVTEPLKDGRPYADALWVMYELGKEVTFSFVWSLHIAQE